MTSFKIDTDVLSENSMKTLDAAKQILDISREIRMVNHTLRGSFPEESIAALRLNHFSDSLEILADRMNGMHRVMDDCAAYYMNAEEQALNDLGAVNAGSKKSSGRSAAYAGKIFDLPIFNGKIEIIVPSHLVGGVGFLSGSVFSKLEIESTVLRTNKVKKAFVSAGIQASVMFAFSYGDVNRTVENMRDAHYARNQRNTDLPKTAEEAQARGWKKSDASLYHQFDSRSKEKVAEDMFRGFPEGNQKYTSGDGREVVYTHDGKQIVTDPKNMGTYNYVEVNNVEDVPGHLALDVIPYWLWGNSADDPTSFAARVLGPLFY